MRINRWAAGLAVVGALGCSSGETITTAPAPETTTSTMTPTTVAPTATTSPSPPSTEAPTTTAASSPADVADGRCEPAPAALVAKVSSGVEASAGPLTSVHVVKSDDFGKVWFVAGRLSGAEGNVGVWATSSLDDGGQTYAVNSFANEFSDWGDGGATGAELSMDDDGAKVAEGCA